MSAVLMSVGLQAAHDHLVGRRRGARRAWWDTPKSHDSRWLSIPRFLIDDLKALVKGREPGHLVFTSPEGDVMRNRAVRRGWFDRAAIAAGEPGLTPHELRHTAASLATSTGANVKAAQRMLGHASAAITLDLYADLSTMTWKKSPTASMWCAKPLVLHARCTTARQAWPLAGPTEDHRGCEGP